MTTEHAEPFAQWAILELMGHRRLAGMVTEQQIFGAFFARIDVPKAEDGDAVTTQFYGPGSIYSITPTTEDIARRFAANYQPQPVSTWDIRQPALPAHAGGGDELADDYRDDDLDGHDREPGEAWL